MSRRQMENARAQESGFRSWSQYQRIAKSKRFRRFADLYYDEHGGRYDRVTGPGSKFTQAYMAADFESDTDSESPLAKLLVMVGLRQPDASYPVGSSPVAV